MAWSEPDHPRDEKGKFAAAVASFSKNQPYMDIYRTGTPHSKGFTKSEVDEDADIRDFDIDEKGVSVEDISLTENLVATQDGVDRDSVLRMAKLSKSGFSKLPLVQVISKGGKNYIVDGHHRVAAARLRQQTTIKAYVLPSKFL